jgi:hypothetical protein
MGKITIDLAISLRPSAPVCAHILILFNLYKYNKIILKIDRDVVALRSHQK